MQVGSTMTVYANGFPTPTSWQWYLDGDPLSGQTASSVTVGVGLEVGSKHTLSVIGKTANQAGSMNIRFRITDTETKGVTTFAGSGAYGFQDGDRTLAMFAEPSGVAVDSAGNVYVADTANHRIRKISPDGTVTTLAGSGVAGLADGVGTSAKFNSPADVALDSAGNVYVADAMNGRIRKISPASEVSTIVGTVIDQSGGSQTTDIFSTPVGIAVDSTGNVYVVDLSSHRILKITPSAEVRVIAGTGTPGYISGTGLAALFYAPKGIAVGANGTLYIADKENNVIRKIVP